MAIVNLGPVGEIAERHENGGLNGRPLVITGTAITGGDTVHVIGLVPGHVIVDATVYLDGDVAGQVIDLGVDYDDADTTDEPEAFLKDVAAATAGRYRANADQPPKVLTENGQLAFTPSADIPASATITIVPVIGFEGTE